jgi:hypothetical protein
MLRVEWLQSALDQLAQGWLEADSELRQGITAAANLLERDLALDPHGSGESRDKGRRFHFVAPIGAHFSIDSDKQIVTVLSVRMVRKRGLTE